MHTSGTTAAAGTAAPSLFGMSDVPGMGLSSGGDPFAGESFFFRTFLFFSPFQCVSYIRSCLVVFFLTLLWFFWWV